ncbi:MAG: ATP-binding protein [Actinomycetales bacterium]|nr:ATP-binding protein [Actinomycetales bacterium]
MSATAPTLSVGQWREHNDAYLSTALDWLRLRLAAAAPAPHGVEERQVHEAHVRLLEAERTFPPPALLLLSEALGLSRFEQDVVLLCCAMELDTRTGALCAAAQDDPRKPVPTFALAMAVLEDPEWSALSPTGSLRAWRLVDVDARSGEPLVLRALRADERVVHFVKGLNVLDERLSVLLRPLDHSPEPLPPSQEAVVDAVAASAADGTGALLQLVGSNRASRVSLASRVATRLGLLLHELPVAALPLGLADAGDLARLWRREARLLPLALLVTADDGDLTAVQVTAVRRLAEEADSPVLLGLAQVCGDLADVSVVHDAATPTKAEQRALWRGALGEDGSDAAAGLATELDLDATEIERVARSARAGGDGDLAVAARARGMSLYRPHLDALAQRLRPAATWADIVLPAEPLRLLRTMAHEARHRGVVYDDWGWRQRSPRGLGISALFTGESGTGKTMAAEVLAGDLGLDLYRIDLSGVVSKYIGETEKNLRRLFDAAEHGGVILFFDEADALFGRRSEVRDSHDRYANIEVNYLLQRMESYHGLAVLATNLRSALDPAFTRRLRFIVPFVLPGPPERERIWAAAFPPQVPTDGLDPRRLARLDLSGALIHSIALHAAFFAATQGRAVAMEHVLDAARLELRKADRSTNEVEAV